ncbi:MAG TPA: hypothetical protein DD990_23770 [Cyanobacteria bacterium UBA11368]|nr:hypothetical protein [Cyanobacteria bacterium UBA11368]
MTLHVSLLRENILAVVIPIGKTQAGLPIGLQIVGKRWREMELLAIAQELDKAIGDPVQEVIQQWINSNDTEA